MNGMFELGRETQFVLELREYINTGKSSRRDPRVANDLVEGMRATIIGKEVQEGR